VPSTTSRRAAPSPLPAGARPEAATAILAAAHRLVAEKGEDFTTQELIKEAGVALQTFYRHYGSKDQLLLAVIAELIAEHCRTVAEAGRTFPGPVERFHFYVSATVSAVGSGDPAGARFLTSQHWRLHQTFPTEMAAATRPYTDLIVSVLAEGRVTGQLHPFDTERQAWLVTKMVMAVFHHYAFVPDDPGLDTMAEDVWRFCFAAVGGAVSA
jgi:TetR/AcrR family transcriptional regulator